MSKESVMVKQVSFIIVVRRIRTLGIVITVGIAAIYLMGLFVVSENKKEDFEIVNSLSLIILAATILLTLIIKNNMLKKVDLSNFETSYFNAHIIPFAILDFAALFCITTNLFVNGNLLYATIASVISVACMIYLFPNEEYFEVIKTREST